MLLSANTFALLLCCSLGAQSQPVHKDGAEARAHSLEWSRIPSYHIPVKQKLHGWKEIDARLSPNAGSTHHCKWLQIHLLIQLSSAFPSSWLQRTGKYQNALISICAEISILRALQNPLDNATANSLCQQQPSSTHQAGAEGSSKQHFQDPQGPGLQFGTLSRSYFYLTSSLTCWPHDKKDADSNWDYNDIKDSNQG